MISVIKRRARANNFCFIFKKHSSVTFIELLIVIVIIGIIAGITLPNFKKTYSNFELENFVKDISYLVRYLQSNSISYNTVCRLDITPNDGHIEFKGLVQEEDAGFIPIKGRFGKTYESTPNITISSIEPPERNNIFFYPDGSLDKTNITFKNKYGKEIKLVLNGTGTNIQIK